MNKATLATEWQPKKDIYNNIIAQNKVENTLYVASYSQKRISYLTATLDNHKFEGTVEHLPHASLKTQLQAILKRGISLSGLVEGQILYTAYPHASIDHLSGYEGIRVSSVASDRNLAFDLLQPFIESEQG